LSGTILLVGLISTAVQPLLALRIGGASAGFIVGVLKALGHIPWWAALALVAVGGAGVITTLILRYGAAYAAAW